MAGLGSQLDQKRRDLANLEPLISDVQQEIANAANAIQTTVKPFNDAIDQVRKLGDQQLTLYDISTPLELTYNARTGLAWYKVILPQGIKLDNAWAQGFRQGTISPPSVDPVSLAVQTGFVDASQSDTYSEFATKLRKSTSPTFISSRRFVDNLSLENATSDVILAIFTGGASLKTSAEEKVQLLMLEWGDVLSWLKRLGIQEAEKIAANIIIDISKGTGSEPNIKMDIGTVNYQYHVTPKLGGPLSEALKLIGIDAPARLSAQASIPHLSFSLSSKQLHVPTIEDVLTELKKELANGPTLDIEQALAKTNVTLPFNTANVHAFEDFQGGASIRALVLQALGSDIENLRAYHVGGLRFDMAGSPAAREFERLLSPLAIGNQHEVHLRELSFDGLTDGLSIKVELRHRHSLGKASDVLRTLGTKLSDARDAAVHHLDDLRSRATQLQNQRDQINNAIADLTSRLIPGANQELARVRDAIRPLCQALAPFGERPPLCSAV